MHRNHMVHKCTLRHRRSEIPSRPSKGRNEKSKHRRKPTPMRLLANAMARASIRGLAYGHGPCGEVCMKKYTEKFCHDSVIFDP